MILLIKNKIDDEVFIIKIKTLLKIIVIKEVNLNIIT